MAQGHDEHGPFDHVLDSRYLELPGFEIPLPGPIDLGPLGTFQLTRFMVSQLVAAALVAAVLIPLARHMAKEPVTRGRFLNLFEAIVLFLRNGIARPAIGAHAGDVFLPYLGTVFFFILFNNLLGLIPGGASATSNINVTAVLALMTLGMVLTAGMREMGPLGFWIGIVPHLDVPKLLKPFLWGLMFVIEVVGLLIRHMVLAIRLFANLTAGHLIMAVILGFIIQAAGIFVYLVTPASLFGALALYLLELLVAFLQAYIFTFLSALFIGAAVHPH